MDFRQVTNEDLYQMCLRGDEPAWEYVYRYVLAIARSPRWRLRDTPEDMAQDIVGHLLTKGIETVKKQGAFRGFIKRVAVNKILDSVKGRAVYFETLDAADCDDGPIVPTPQALDPGPDQMVYGNELLRAIQEALNDMSQLCREALGAYVDYKMGQYENYKVLAQEFGRSIGTLSSQIKRCLDELRQVGVIKEWLEA